MHVRAHAGRISRIVPKAALEPFRVATPERERALLPYLREPAPMLYDLALEVGLVPEGGAETVIARTNYREMYYSSAQQLAHHRRCLCAPEPKALRHARHEAARVHDLLAKRLQLLELLLELVVFPLPLPAAQCR